VERRNKQNIKGEIGEITKALQDGFSVVVFAEATSTNGSSVLPFKRSLLAAAVESKTPVLPICVQYEEIDGEKVTAKNRDKLCWYGTMDFAPHFLELAGLNQIKVRVKILEEIPIEAETTRDTLVDKAYAAVSSNYTPIV
jgi:1-acyl-sn-glycerol-3-phosphate acyltransferase